jgi:cobalt-zinc-cadmium efflux system outer membrane protein
VGPNLIAVNRVIQLALIAAVSCFSHSLCAQTHTQTKTVFTLDQLVQLALESNPQVMASRDQTRASSGQLRSAKAIPNPEFEVNTGQQRGTSGSLTTGNVSSWAVTQPLDMPYTRFPRVNAAEASMRAAEANRVALTKQIQNRMQLRYDVGETARFELIRAQTEFLNAEIVAQASKLRIEQARSQLRKLVGFNLPVNFEIQAKAEKLPQLPELKVLLTELRNQSPELKRAKAEVEASESRLSFEQNSRLPRLSVKAQQYNDPNFTDRLYGLVVSIPIWDFRSGQITEAESNASRARNQLNAQTQNLEAQLESAYKLYEMTSFQVKTLDEKVVQLAASARRIAETSYRYGERGMLEYLDAQRTFRAARNDLIRARFELASIVNEIERLRASSDWVAMIEGKK